jgi:DNA-binding PadR family transcriptional regulator
MLGEFEYLVLTAASRMQDQGYGAAIRKEIEEVAGRPCSIGALYITLDRLESKGLITTSMGDPSPQRGGRARRMVRVTAKGKRMAAEFYSGVRRMTRGVAWA